MTECYTYMCAPFDPGAGKIKEALKIYREMQYRNHGYFDVVVEEKHGFLEIRIKAMDKATFLGTR